MQKFGWKLGFYHSVALQRWSVIDRGQSPVSNSCIDWEQLGDKFSGWDVVAGKHFGETDVGMLGKYTAYFSDELFKELVIQIYKINFW